jgi:hypothetical protein
MPGPINVFFSIADHLGLVGGKQLVGWGGEEGPATAGGGGSRQYSGRENLEQLRTIESLTWASGINSYSLVVYTSKAQPCRLIFPQFKVQCLKGLSHQIFRSFLSSTILNQYFLYGR